MAEHKYVIQRRYQTELAKKVGHAMGQIFDHINGDSLHVNETVTSIVAPKPLTKKQRDKLCAFLMSKAKEEGDAETMSFECVPYTESLEAKAGGNHGI